MLQRRLGVTTILVTHDQEEALSIADRVVVMNQGVIDQVGTPEEVYRRPNTPFVADFVGKTNILPAVVRENAELEVGSVRLKANGAAINFKVGAQVAIFLRPEDVVVRGAGESLPGSLPGRVENIEFLGPICRLGIRVEGIDSRLVYADLSPRGMDAFNLEHGCAVSVTVPGDSMRIFPTIRTPAVSAVLSPSTVALRPVSQKAHWTDRIGHVALLAMGALLGTALFAPIWMILAKSFEDKDGQFVGLANFIAYFQTPALSQSIWNSVWVSGLVTLITVPAAFTFAYALTRSCMRYKSLLRNIALIPLLAPSLLSAISFIYWFGNQGALKSWLGEHQIYGASGIVLSLVYATFPHALMILITALSLTDGRLYEAADSMGTRASRKFFTITLPAAKYGVISAAMVVFTYAISDFGVPKVIGGNFNVLATDIFKLVIGQQDFAKGAVVGIILLVPVLITYIIDMLVQRRQMAQLTARSVPYAPKPARGFDFAMATFCWGVGALMLAVLGMAVYASVIKLWPYDLSFSLIHYRMGLVEPAFSTPISTA